MSVVLPFGFILFNQASWCTLTYCIIAGFYHGSGGHYDHTRCFDNTCGFDLHDHKGMDHEVAWNITQYSTHLFTTKAQDIVKSHDQDKVDEDIC
jgi:hypothetical protein